ncbi:MAG: hypothetical protein MUD01_28945 [Chloroflexaceae bacterium]|nr:hypothetical protein [Chloroflexaceae bacterium]
MEQYSYEQTVLSNLATTRTNERERTQRLALLALRRQRSSTPRRLLRPLARGLIGLGLWLLGDAERVVLTRTPTQPTYQASLN